MAVFFANVGKEEEKQEDNKECGKNRNLMGFTSLCLRNFFNFVCGPPRLPASSQQVQTKARPQFIVPALMSF